MKKSWIYSRNFKRFPFLVGKTSLLIIRFFLPSHFCDIESLTKFSQKLVKLVKNYTREIKIPISWGKKSNKMFIKKPLFNNEQNLTPTIAQT